MELAQLAQLKAMSQSERLGYYFKKLVNKEITREQYDKAIKFLAKLADEETYQEGEILVGGDGGTGNRDSGADAGRPIEYSVSESGRGHADATDDRDERPISSMEFVSQLSPTASSDGTTHPERKSGVSQKARLLDLLSDGEWHNTPSIQCAVYGANHLGVARIAARIQDLKDEGYTIESNKVNASIWEYRMVDAKLRQVASNISSA